MLSKYQNVKVTGLKAFKKCLIFLSDLVEMSYVRPNQEGVVTGLSKYYPDYIHTAKVYPNTILAV